MAGEMRLLGLALAAGIAGGAIWVLRGGRGGADTADADSREARPAPTAAEAAPASAASTAEPPFASGASPSSPPIASAAAAAGAGESPPPAEPPSSPEPREERRARVTWAARPGRSEARVAAGARCAIEATVAVTEEGELHLASAITARCGRTTLYERDGLPPGAVAKVKEQPGLARGTYTYTLVYDDGSAKVDTPHARASIAGAPLLVAGESRPVTARLLAGTPELRVLQAGTYATPEHDDEATGRVVAASGDTLAEAGARCGIAFHHYGTVDGVDKCDVLVLCGEVTLIGRPELFSTTCRRRGKRVIVAQDLQAQPEDSDPAIDLDEHRARVWNGADGARWSVTIALDPRR